MLPRRPKDLHAVIAAPLFSLASRLALTFVRLTADRNTDMEYRGSHDGNRTQSGWSEHA